MASYYTIIAGKRYSASLVNNAKFRTRGAGDGRISLQDAQDLWQIAQDGGRITEIEEDTLAYLLEGFNWTGAAKSWLEETLSTEVAKTKTYYQVIDGLRYDRRALAEADKSVAGQGDGRISVDDAEKILPLLGDLGNITVVEERTIKYMLSHYKWTPEAEKWFRERVDAISKQSDMESELLHIMQSEYGFQKLSFDYYKSEALYQVLEFVNNIDLPGALRKALDSLLNDASERSFLNNFSYVEAPKEYLEEGRLVLLPGDIASERTLSSFPSPNRGESVTENWIFGLELFDLTDDIYWVIVPRNGKGPVYNYVGGPNVGDLYHIIEEDAFFTFAVEACDVPLPKTMVEMQDPTGKNILSKSDEGGNVLVTGPEGTYSIHVFAGLRSKSEKFRWDGKGKEQVSNVVLDC